MTFNVQLTTEQIEHISSFLKNEIVINIRGVDYETPVGKVIGAYRRQRGDFAADTNTRDVLDADAAILDILTAAMRQNDSEQTLVPLTQDDIENICYDIASELFNDSGVKPDGLQEDDYAAVLRYWRDYSPRYIADAVKRQTIAKERGFAVRVEPRAELEGTRAMHDASADRLERLLPFLEGASVAS